MNYLKVLNRELREGIRSALCHRVAAVKPKLNFVCFGITDACVLRCRMCYKWKEDMFVDPQAKAPSLRVWKSCVSSLREISDESLQINFGGGEPLLKQDILEIVAFAKSRGFKTNIASNGYLIDDVLAKEMGRCGLDSIIFSLDSLTEDTHDYLRGVKGTHKKVMDSIARLDRFSGGLYQGVCCVIYEQNLDEIIKLAKWVEANKSLDSVYFMAAMQPNNTPWDPGWYQKEEFGFIWPKDTVRVCSIIDELIELKKQGFKITNQINQLEAFKLYYQFPARFVKQTGCNMDSALHISSCGDIFLCYRWPRLGNIQSDDLTQIWHSRNAEEVRSDIEKCRNNCHFLLNCYFEGDYPFQLKQQQ